MTAPRITAVTGNPAKLRELQRLIGELAEVIPLPIAAGDPAPAEARAEPGTTVEEIAAAKAVGSSRRLAARGSPSLTITSDGGLLMPALGDAWDPLQTRRFAGQEASDQERCRRLLALAQDVADEDRTIAWREAVAIADRGRLIGAWSATGASGRLARTGRDDLLARAPGFWLPSLWEAPEFGFRRLAELTDDERESLDDHWNRLRHPVRDALGHYLARGNLTESRRSPSEE